MCQVAAYYKKDTNVLCYGVGYASERNYVTTLKKSINSDYTILQKVNFTLRYTDQS
jgi:hypothetical protein